MDAEEFRRRGKEMVDFVADYLEKDIRQYPPLSQVQPGYLKELVPQEAPSEPESYDDLMDDVRRVIMPGISHWQSPDFHAYFAATTSYASTLADILSDSIGCIGFTWAASPACTELEVVMMDWLAKMLQLPQDFMSGGKGGGVIQGTASEATLVALLAARSKTLSHMKEQHPSWSDADIMDKMVAYSSDQAHSSVERACLLGAVKCRQVASDDADEMRGDALEAAIREDEEKGLIPFYVVATLGTTPSCSFDHLQEIGPVCRSRDLWLHVDAAYAGSAFICSEFRPLLDGVELADSFNFNPHKWMLVTFDCSALWFKDTTHVIDAFNVDPLYLKHTHQDKMPDYRHWQIPLGRRFRSLKIWFVLRLYGVSGIQRHIRKHVELAQKFEALVRADSRFKVTHKVTMGLVCFILKDQPNTVNEELLKRINNDGRIHMVPSKSKGTYFLRFAVCATRTELTDIQFAWHVITELSTALLAENNAVVH